VKSARAGGAGLAHVRFQQRKALGTPLEHFELAPALLRIARRGRPAGEIPRHVREALQCDCIVQKRLDAQAAKKFGEPIGAHVGLAASLSSLGPSTPIPRACSELNDTVEPGLHRLRRRSDWRQAGTFANGLDCVDHFIRRSVMNHVTNAGQQYQVAMADGFVQSRGLPVGI
jgi:hypothetical protein